AKHRSLKIDVNNYGEMIVQLFEDKAPLPTARIIELAQSGFFNFAVNPQTSAVTNKITFHRVIDGFVIQTGDPTNTGSGGSTLGDFDDQYHPDLQHNRTGVVSYAKAFDDGNDSQFFFTEGPQRDLDFNHSVFGQLVEGDAVREGISRVPPMPGDDDKPSREIRINSVSVFEDQENGLVLLRATGLAGQQAEVTVTVTDAQGHSVSQVFQVTVAADTFNSG